MTDLEVQKILDENKTRHIILKSVIFILLVVNINLQAQPESNLDVLSELFLKPVIHAFDSLSPKPESVVIIIRNKNPFGNWLNSMLSESVLERSIRLFDHADSTSAGSHRLIIEGAEVQISYESKNRNLLFKTTRLTRDVKGILEFIIKDNSGQILKSQSQTIEFQDEVGGSQVKKIENTHYPFTRGTKKESKFIKRLFEPLIVTAATIGVVYLFYSLGSDSK